MFLTGRYLVSWLHSDSFKYAPNLFFFFWGWGGGVGEGGGKEIGLLTYYCTVHVSWKAFCMRLCIVFGDNLIVTTGEGRFES